MRSEVGEWLATCVGSPICILLLSWSLLIYQNQPSSIKRRVDVLAVALLAQSLAHQLGLLLFAILTLVHPANHFGEFCSSLVWLLNTSSILQELSLTSTAAFAALTARDDGPKIKKHHLKYHLVSLSAIGACVGISGVLNFEPQGCVFLAQEISPKYGLFFNGLRVILAITSLISLSSILLRNLCRPTPRAELLKSVSDLSEASSKNSTAGAYECQQQQQQQRQQHWEQSATGSYSSGGSTNSRACLKRRDSSEPEVDEASGRPTLYAMLFVCYVFHHLPMLIISIRPEIIRNYCTPQNLAAWLPLIKDTLLPVSLAVFDKMFCRYVARVYTKQDHSTRLTHGGIDGKFRHFEQDGEYKLQLNLNHGLSFPISSANNVSNGSLYGRLPSHQNRGRSNTMQLGLHYSRSGANLSSGEYASMGPESSTCTSCSNLDLGQSQQQLIHSHHHHHQQRPQESKPRTVCRANSFASPAACKPEQLMQPPQLGRRKLSNSELRGQRHVESLALQLGDQPYVHGAHRLKHFAKSLDEIREEAGPRLASSVQHLHRQHHQPSQLEQLERARRALRRNQSFDLQAAATRYPRIELPLVAPRNYDAKRELDLKRNLRLIEQNRRNEEEYEENEEAGYETSSDDESCDGSQMDFDTLSSCRSRPRSCCSVTTVANDDFEYFQRKNTRELQRAPPPSTQQQQQPESKGSMRCFTPRIIEATANAASTQLDSKPVIQSYKLKSKKMSPGYSLNDLDKFQVSAVNNPRPVQVSNKLPTLSIESLKSILRSSDVSYLDNGEVCRHDLGGSAPDFKKIFVTEFI